MIYSLSGCIILVEGIRRSESVFDWSCNVGFTGVMMNIRWLDMKCSM